ncbi:MAG TPA: mandelate racemase/muconate lactonizing enzyme family protein [Dongiaceae bacterium]|nr:mandelate racemase/muconate lactonizing enzyme family protein [Dongiaceae bacterium]
MKITRIETIPLSIPHPPGHQWLKGEISSTGWDLLVVRVHTDEGISGIGEAYHLKNPHAVVATIEHTLAPLVIGRDPFDNEQIWANMFARTVQLGSAAIAGIAGIDTALWDIKGKALNLPVYKLLGGANIKEIPLYTGGHVLGYRPLDNLKDLVTEAERYVKKGYKALKMRGGRGLPHRGDLESAWALRKAFGSEIELLIDVNSEYGDFSSSERMAREVEPLNLYWLEDPFRFTIHYHNEETARLAKEAKVPIATGGNVYGRFSIKRIIEHGGVDYVMCNVSKAGGLSEVRKIINLVETWNLKYSPHCDGGLNAMGNFHLFASAPPQVTANVYHEFDPVYPYDQLLTHPPEIRDGKAIVSDRPGLGTDLLDGLQEKYPFKSDTWFIHKH